MGIIYLSTTEILERRLLIYKVIYFLFLVACLIFVFGNISFGQTDATRSSSITEKTVANQASTNSISVTALPEKQDTIKTQKPKASTGGRCQATTKKGKQCKRNASSGSYCWQHK